MDPVKNDNSTYAPSSEFNAEDRRRDEDETLNNTSAQNSLEPSLKEKDEEAAVGADVQLPTEQGEDAEYPAGFRLIMVVVALALSIFLVALDMTIVATAIPKITDEFHGLDLVGWYGSGFFITLAAFQSTWGKAYKYFPLKISFLLSVFIFELGSLICGVAPNSTALIVGRAIAGLGGAGIASGAYTIIGVAVRPQLRPAFTGILGASYGVASVVGPLLGGVFADITWRWCFYINLPIGGVSAAVIFFFFTTPPQHKPVAAPLKEKILQMDPIGTIWIMGAVICYILALQWAGISKPWKSADVIGTLVGFGVLTICFVISEYFLGEYAMISLRVFKKRVVHVGMFYAMFLGGAFFLLLYYLPIYFQVIDGVSASNSGVRNLPLIIATTIGTISSGMLITMFGHFVPFMILAAMGTTVGCGLIYTLTIGSSSAHWIGYQVVAGLFIGFGFQIPVISTQALVSPEDLSAATAMVLFTQTLGGALFVSAGEVALTNVLLNRLPITAPTIDAQTIVSVGASSLRATFSPDVLPGIILGYMDGLHTSYIIAIASAGVAFLISLASEWRRIEANAAAGAA